VTDRATFVAPANIAFVKYWGARDLDRAVPWNRSISMTLERCVSRCTVERAGSGRAERVLFRPGPGAPLAPAPPPFAARVRAHLDRLREAARADVPLDVATENTFPAAAGLASSASGFAALTLAAATVLGVDGTAEELSVLARLSGSGSAARSVLGGYVVWPRDTDDPSLAARALAPAEHWELRDVIAIVDSGEKTVSSRDGHARVRTSPYFERRLDRLGQRLEAVAEAISRRSLERMGPVIEEEAIDLHLIAMSSTPPIFYWKPATLAVLDAVRRLRDGGTPAWATMDAGPNVHVICEPAAEGVVARALADVPGVEDVVRDGVGPGPRAADEPVR
jgi:diphosphomevalonate decarboxylase